MRALRPVEPSFPQLSLTTLYPDNIPSLLKFQPSWLIWHPAKEAASQTHPDGKILKKPLLGKSWQNRLQPYEDIHAQLNQHQGLGFAYTLAHPFLCIDIDELTPDNLSLVTRLDSYTEVSPSGKGYHVIIAAQSLSDKAMLQAVFGNGKRNLANKRDLFIANGYVTVTGSLPLIDFHGVPTRRDTIRILPIQQIQDTLELFFSSKITTLHPPQAPRKQKAEAKQIAEAGYVKTLLTKLPVTQLDSGIFDRLALGENVILDPACTEEAREPWLIIGQAIHNNFNGGAVGYKLWDTWSSAGTKYNEETLIATWNSFGKADGSAYYNSQITIASLVKLANAQTVDFPDINSKGQILGTVENLKAYLNQQNIRLATNELSKQTEISVPESKALRWGVNVQYLNLGLVSPLISSDFMTMHIAPRAFSSHSVKEYLKAIATNNTVNPIRDYFIKCGKNWDGKDRITDLANTITTPQNLVQYNHIFRQFIRKWLIQVAAAACHSIQTPARLNRVLILAGPQDIGKTKWVESLFPQELRRYCAADKEMKLGKFKSESTKLAMELTSTLICNINEIDRLFSSSSYADFKAFLDQTTDQVVLPYGEAPVEMSRRTVFIGSCNTHTFLKDVTGNRRFEIISVTRLKTNHGINIDQLWGQVFNLYDSGEVWWFNSTNPGDQEVIAYRDDCNAKCMMMPHESFAETLDDIFDVSAPLTEWQQLTLRDIRALTGLAPDDSARSIPLKKIKETLGIWRSQVPGAPEPYTGSGPRARVFYLMPPLKQSKFPEAAFNAAETRDTSKSSGQ